MTKQPEKKCPVCGSVFVRIYKRIKKEGSQSYFPIGIMCPDCTDAMIILDNRIEKNSKVVTTCHGGLE